MKRNLIFIILVALAAFAIAAAGAWFSVYGLTKVFPAGLLTFFIFGALEFAKLVVVSYVYRFWKITKFFQRIYLILATVVLMGITSMGIYGFLTNAYQTTSTQLEIVDKRTSILEMKRDRYQQEYAEYNTEKESLNQQVNELTKGLVNNQIQYIDQETGQLVTSTSRATRQALQEQLADAKDRRTLIYDKTEALSDSIAKYDMEILDLKSTEVAGAEIGPLKYIARLTGLSMDRVVNWLSLLIVFVFDPLAVVLIISLNQLMVFSGFDPFSKTKSLKQLKTLEDPTNIKETTTTTKNEITTTTALPETTTTTVIETTTLAPKVEKIKPNPTTTTTTADAPRLNNTVETTTLKNRSNPDNLLAKGKNQEHTDLSRPGDP